MPLVTVDGLPRADHDCCLWRIGSITTPACIVKWQKEIAMGKRTDTAMDSSPPGACAGRSLIEMLEDQLDEEVDWLKDPENVKWGDVQIAEHRGKAQGFAESLAILLNPYYPNLNGVRAASVERWEWRTRVREEKERLPIHRTEAGWPQCSTCDGGGCPDCTDPA